MNPSTALARVLLDALVAHGVTELVLSPGSRSAPLALAAFEVSHGDLARNDEGHDDDLEQHGQTDHGGLGAHQRPARQGRAQESLEHPVASLERGGDAQ